MPKEFLRKNLSLIACFAGLGLGYALADRKHIALLMTPVVLAFQFMVFTFIQFGMPDTVLNKYSDEHVIPAYWWVDPDSEADLESAMENDEKLSGTEFKVRFDERFRP